MWKSWSEKLPVVNQNKYDEVYFQDIYKEIQN